MQMTGLVPSERRASPLALLLSRRFGPLFATQFLSAFNDNALKNALVLMVAYRADAGDALSAGLLIPLSGMLSAPGHGEFTVAGLIVVVALAAWASSLAIPATRPAAAPAPFRWNLAAATAQLIREAVAWPVPFRAMLGISWFWLVGALYLA